MDKTAGSSSIAEFLLLTQRSFLLDLSRELNHYQISYAQYFLLCHLDREDGLTMSDIARKMGHSTAAATGLVDRLERLEYVQRTHAEDDRRRVEVRILPKGRTSVNELTFKIADSMDRAFGQLEPEQRETMNKTFDLACGAMNSK